MAMVATMLMIVKYAGEAGISLPEIVFWRLAIPTVLMFLWFAASRNFDVIRTHRVRSHLARALIGMAGLVCMFLSVTLLHLAESTTLSFTAPLYAVVLTALVLREHVGLWRWIAVGLGFTGVLIIAQPSIAQVSMTGTAAGLVSGLFVAIVTFQIRDLARTENTMCIVFYFSLFGALIAGVAVPFFMTTHNLFEWSLLFAVGAIGTLSQWLIATSLRYGSVMGVIVIDYTTLIWSTLFGWLIWNSLPAWTTWLGAPAIIAAGLLIAWREHLLVRPAPSIATN